MNIVADLYIIVYWSMSEKSLLQSRWSLCGRFCLYSVDAVRYAALIQAKSFIKYDIYFAEGAKKVKRKKSIEKTNSVYRA